MASQCCPTCGRNFPKPRAVQIPAVDLSELTTAELYAYYKRTAVHEDLRFFVRYCGSDALQARAEALTNPTAKDIALLRTLWRIERQNADRAAGIPAIGTPAWREANDDKPMETEELTQIAS